ncbi:phage tail tip lysozyme [Bradyrhizobium sp. USDA 4350]
MNGTPNPTSSWFNFAQQPVDQGGLGLAPHQAAGLVGNLVHESGQDLTPWGPTGDNGTAWGTAQWRGDRLDALKSMYPDSYQTTEAQQAFLRHEMMGSENKAYKALIAAKTPEEAATAVNHLYERSADTTGNRERSARQLMTQFGGGDQGVGGTGAPALSYSGDDEDTPTTAGTQPALSAMTTLGPGALQRVMSAPKSDDSLNNLGQMFTGIGASLASISNPQQAYALNQQLQSMKKDTESKFKIIPTKDGRIIRVDQDGNVDTVGGPGSVSDPNAQAPQMLPTWGKPELLQAGTPEAKEAYINSMVGGQGAMVRGILENTLPPPTAAAMAKKDSPWPAAFAAAQKIDPTIDPNAYNGRVAGYRDWATKGAESARALNQTIAHQSEALVGAMKGLNNSDTPLMNDAKNWWSEHVSGSGAVPGFRTSAHAVVDELGKVFKQNNLSDTEIRKWEENLPANMSPEQQRTQIKVFQQLMHGAMQALEDKRKQAIGDYAAAKQKPLLSDEGRKGLQALDDFANSGPKPKGSRPPLSTLIPLNQ